MTTVPAWALQEMLVNGLARKFEEIPGMSLGLAVQKINNQYCNWVNCFNEQTPIQTEFKQMIAELQTCIIEDGQEDTVFDKSFPEFSILWNLMVERNVRIDNN
jgi:hypothetical protein